MVPTSHSAVNSQDVVARCVIVWRVVPAHQLPVNMLGRECRYDLPYTTSVRQRERADSTNKMQVLVDQSGACAAGGPGSHNRLISSAALWHQAFRSLIDQIDAESKQHLASERQKLSFSPTPPSRKRSKARGGPEADVGCVNRLLS